jgi:DNA replication protein DnaC
VIYRRLQWFFPELTLAQGDGTYPIVLARFARVDVLILDDWGLVGLKDAQRHDLLEMLDDRAGGRSTIITSQLPSDRWHDYLGEPTVADAILDRVMHRAHRLTLTGPSRRKPTGPGTAPAAATSA